MERSASQAMSINDWVIRGVFAEDTAPLAIYFAGKIQFWLDDRYFLSCVGDAGKYADKTGIFAAAIR
jgi:hypothetical protein